MAGVTNALVEYTDQMGALADAREYDVVVSSRAVQCWVNGTGAAKSGIQARSWLGWQIPIWTDNVHGKARISGINTENIVSRLEVGEVAVVPGFQGMGTIIV